MTKTTRKYFSSVIIFLISTVLINCSGSMEDFATTILYPLSVVNKIAIPDVPIEGFAKTSVKGANSDTSIWYYKNPNPTAPVIVYYHGNGLNIGGLAQYNMLKKMQILDTHLVVFDYPFYGKSTGELNERGLLNSGFDAFNWTKANFPSSKIIIWGQSLGAGVAIQAAKANPSSVHRLILTQPWDELKSIIITHYSSLMSVLPAEWFSLHEYNSVKHAKQITIPTLIHHGMVDTLIPIKFGKILAESFPNGVATFYPIPEKNHNDLLLEQKIWEDIKAFAHQ